MRSLITFGFPPPPLCRIRAPDRARAPPFATRTSRSDDRGGTLVRVRSSQSAPKWCSPVCLKIIGGSVAYTRCERPLRRLSGTGYRMVRRATHDRGAPYPTTATNRGDVERISASRSSVRAALRGRIEAQRPSGDPMSRGLPRGRRRVGTRGPIVVVREAGAVPRRRRRRVHPHPRATRARARASNLASLASQEPDAEIALEVWDEVVRLARRSGELATPTGGNWMYSRATCLGGLSRWTDAERAYAEAADILELALESSGPGSRDRAGALTLALAHDGRSLALGALADWPAAVDASRRALAAGGAAGVAENGGIDVPTTALLAGLRGGPPTVAQRLDFNAAMARWGAGDVGFAANALARLDKGPSPVAGRGGQFWEARAALAAALYANGSLPAAEAEWSQLCEPVGPNPPATPSDPFRKVVNKAAQGAFDAGILMDKRCEDFSTGTPLPCDDAGIPGSGGSASPCLIFTDAETERRLWRREAVAARVHQGRAGGVAQVVRLLV